MLLVAMLLMLVANILAATSSAGAVVNAAATAGAVTPADFTAAATAGNSVPSKTQKSICHN
jgi:hypothetical protein